MKKHIRVFVAVFLLAIIAFACTVPSTTATPAPVQTEPQVAPFVGLWMSETETLAFTQKNLYRVQSNPETGQVNEQFAEIIVNDPSTSHITLRIQWVRVNGISVGFDAPVYSLSYKVDGDVLQIGLGSESEFTTELSPTIYYRK
ncbi:MAG: hypothetical protein U0V02_02075 [Anaerolineales bacterium]